MTKPKRELLIWWTTDRESVISPPRKLPDYARSAYAERCQVSGHAQLFVPEKFGQREIADWPDTFITRMIRDGSYAGVVFGSPDSAAFKEAVGFVTDFQLRVLVL